MVSARFIADFSSFSSAVAKAEVELRSFESGASKVGGTLNRMTDSFSGRKVIQEATLMAEVFKRAGGAATFTTAELARMGGAGAEAMAKLRATGAPIPPQLQAMADATKGVDKAHGQLLDTVKKVAVAFGAMFTARAAVNFATDVLKQASDLKDLGQQTHINVEELQLLAGAMSEFGVDADTLGKGLFALSRKIAGGDESIVEALGRMGLSLADVQGLQGQELFLKMEKGLSVLQGSLRDTTASDLFGSRLGMAMAGASEGIEGAMEAAKRLNTVMGKESIDALDAYGESIARMQRSLTAMAANMMGPVAQGFNTLTDAIGKGTSKLAIFWAMTKDAFSKSHFGGSGTEHLAALLDELNKKTEQSTGSVKTLTAAHVAFVGPLQSTSDAIAFNKKALAERNQALAEAKAALEKLAAVHKQFTDSVTTATEALHLSVFAVNRFNVVLPTAISRSQEFTEVLRDWIPVLESATGGLDGVTGSVEELGRSGQHTAAVLVGMGDEALMGVLVPAIKGSGEAIHAVDTEVNTFGDSLNSIQHDLRAFPDLLVKAFTGGGGVSGAMKALGVQIADDLLGPLTKKAGDVIGSLTKSIGGKIAGGLGMGSAVGSAAGLAGTVALGAATMGISVAASLAIAGLQKLWSMRGPSKEEREARGETGEIQKQIAAIATATQQAEAAAAGWAGAIDLVVVRDAYKAIGKTAEEAQRDVAAVWNDKDQDAHRAALERINAALVEQAGLAAATGDAAAAASTKATAAQEAQTSAMQRTLDALFSQRDSLMQSIAGEAPEEVMGVIEAATRAQMAVLQTQIDAQQRELESQAQEVADSLEQALGALDPKTIHIPIEWDIPDLPGGRVSLTESGSSRFVPFRSGAAASAASAGVQTIITKTYLDVRQIAEALTRVRV